MSCHANSGSLTVAVAGGNSAERSISLASGRNVAAALEAAGHQVRWIDPAEYELAEVPWSAIDVCFIALHGGAGEDGRVQRRLDLLHVPYTGSGPQASRLAMSKSAAKERLLDAQVSTPPYVLFNTADPTSRIAAKAARLGLPLIIKPDSQGSSLGVSLVRETSELTSAVDCCRQLDPFGVAEVFIAGRELTVAVLGRELLPPIEILPREELFSFDAKYHDHETAYRVDPPLPPVARADLEQAALATCEALSTRGLVRIDMMLDADGHCWVLEANTVPGMTVKSLAPMAALAAGIDLPALCDRLVREPLALEATR